MEVIYVVIVELIVAILFTHAYARIIARIRAAGDSRWWLYVCLTFPVPWLFGIANVVGVLHG